MVTLPTVVITMAGESRRFSSEGIDSPKWKLLVKGQTIFWWSLLSLRQYSDAGANFVFIARRDHAGLSFINNQAALLNIPRWNILEIDGVTQGQAATVMAGVSLLPPDKPIAIYNIDTHVNPDSLPLPPSCCDGWIPYFDAPPGSWSYLKTRPDGTVTEVAEKRAISTKASIGFYYFKSIAAYEAAYKSSDRSSAAERYVAPLYNSLIRRGARVLGHEVPVCAVIPLGTPAEVDLVDPGWRSVHGRVALPPENWTA